MARFQNTATGRETTVPDVLNSPDRVRQAQHAHMLSLMDKSKRWLRLDPAPPVAEPEPELGETPADKAPAKKTATKRAPAKKATGDRW